MSSLGLAGVLEPDEAGSLPSELPVAAGDPLQSMQADVAGEGMVADAGPGDESTPLGTPGFTSLAEGDGVVAIVVELLLAIPLVAWVDVAPDVWSSTDPVVAGSVVAGPVVDGGEQCALDSATSMRNRHFIWRDAERATSDRSNNRSTEREN